MDPKIQKIIDDFALFDDWEDKYAYLIDLGKKLPNLDVAYKIPQNLVQGCTSQVWFIPDPHADKPDLFYFKADSDAYIVKGLVAILKQVYEGRKKTETADIDIHALFERLGLKQHLSPSRSNGFYAMVNRLIDLAQQS